MRIERTRKEIDISKNKVKNDMQTKNRKESELMRLIKQRGKERKDLRRKGNQRDK